MPCHRKSQELDTLLLLHIVYMNIPTIINHILTIINSILMPCHRKSQELELHLMVCSASTRPSSAVSSTSSRRSISTGVDRPWLTSSKCRGSRWNAGEAGEIHGEIYGKSMEIYQKSRENHGNLSKIQGKLWTSIKNPGKTMDIYQKSRETMDIYQTIQGKLWTSIKQSRENYGNLSKIQGNLWKIHGKTWETYGISLGVSENSIENPGDIWKFYGCLEEIQYLNWKSMENG